MATDPMATSSPAASATTGLWHIDPARSSVEFHVRHFYGLTTIHGRFERYHGTLDLNREPAVQLTIDAASLDTKHTKRDKHLRSPDFFDIEHHPQVRFASDSVKLDGETLKIRGQLEAAGKQVPVELDARVRPVDDELEIEAATQVDHRKLGMMWSPLGILRAPSTLTVRGRLVREQPTP